MPDDYNKDTTERVDNLESDDRDKIIDELNKKD